MLTVYGRATSSNEQLWAIGELGLAHERLDYGHVHGGLETETFSGLNPHRKLPRWFTMEIPRKPRPALEAYYHRLTERPAYRDHVMVDYTALRAEGA